LATDGTWVFMNRRIWLTTTAAPDSARCLAIEAPIPFEAVDALVDQAQAT